MIPSKNSIKEIVNRADVLIVTAVIEIVLNLFIIVNPRVPTPSIGNTIMTGDRIIRSGLMYFFKELKRGDIIILKFPDNNKKYYVKRIISDNLYTNQSIYYLYIFITISKIILSFGCIINSIIVK